MNHSPASLARSKGAPSGRVQRTTPFPVPYTMHPLKPNAITRSNSATVRVGIVQWQRGSAAETLRTFGDDLS